MSERTSIEDWLQRQVKRSDALNIDLLRFEMDEVLGLDAGSTESEDNQVEQRQLPHPQPYQFQLIDISQINSKDDLKKLVQQIDQDIQSMALNDDLVQKVHSSTV